MLIWPLNGSQFVHEDLEQIHEDDLDEMDLKWQLALLSMKARKFYQRTGKKSIINGVMTRKRWNVSIVISWDILLESAEILGVKRAG
ncbi:hypothetical protein Tco_1306209, partial [Tanacetum coccineum]